MVADKYSIPDPDPFQRKLALAAKCSGSVHRIGKPPAQQQPEYEQDEELQYTSRSWHARQLTPAYLLLVV